MLVNFIYAFTQNEYSRGFKIGYEIGFCYNDFGCIPPIVPTVPITKVGERLDSYQDGYNRGFKQGLEHKKKVEMEDENINRDGTGRRNVLPSFNPEYYQDEMPEKYPNLDGLALALKQRQDRYDKNKKYLDGLIDWVFELKSKTNNQDFLSAMDKYYKKLREFDDKDLSVLSNEIRNIELGIKEEISNYNSGIYEKKDIEKYWKEGHELFDKREYIEAIDKYSILIKSDIETAYLFRGISYFFLRKYELAISDLTKTIQLQPGDEMAYHFRGWAYFYVKNYMGALEDFNLQIEIAPLEEEPYYNRGTIKAALNDHYGAINDYRKSISIKPNFSMAYNNIAWSLFQQKKYSQGLLEVNKAIILDEENQTAWDTRAEIKFHLHDYKGCIDDANQAIRLNPKFANPHYLKGLALYKLGKKQEACSVLSKAGECGKKEAYSKISKMCNN